MKNIFTHYMPIIILVLTLNSCIPNPQLYVTATMPAPKKDLPTLTSVLSTPTLLPRPIPSPTLTPEPTLPQISVTIQEGNALPKYGLHPKQSGELVDNRIGTFAGGLTGGGWKPGEPWDYNWMVNQITSRGVKRFRVSIDNLDAGSPDLDWSIPQYTIDPSHDALITMLARQGITMTYVLTFWDKDTWPGGKGANCPRFKTEAEVERYLQWVKFMVHHFKDRIQNYELWNEPNTIFCPQKIEINDYINLVNRTVPVVRQEYPEAKIAVGATNYLNDPGTQEYLFKILNSDIMPLVDIISWHAMYGTSPEFDPEYYSEYPFIVQKIKNTASAHGFHGTYEADELTWFTIGGNNWDGWSKQYSDTVAAKYMARGITMNLGMGVTAGIGSALIFDSNWVAIPIVVQNLSTIMVEAEITDAVAQIDSETKNVKSYNFSLPNGDRLIALWNDEKAVDEDPGVPIKITIPGFTGWTATAIDVLHGFEQTMISYNEGSNIIIRDFLLKDYPIIIQLSK